MDDLHLVDPLSALRYVEFRAEHRKSARARTLDGGLVVRWDRAPADEARELPERNAVEISRELVGPSETDLRAVERALLLLGWKAEATFDLTDHRARRIWLSRIPEEERRHPAPGALT